MVFFFPPAPPVASPSAVLTFEVEATEAHAVEQQRLLAVDEAFGILKGCGVHFEDVVSEHDQAARLNM